MATVTFTQLWLNPLGDLSTGMGFRLASLSTQPQTPGEIRQYGTRLRSVDTGVPAQQLPVTVRCDTREQVAFLEANQRQTVCARDPRGRKFYARYFDLQIAETPSVDVRVNATFTLNEVTVSEAV